MTRAVDPFEEYLRKKKVEMLEQKYRGDSDEESDASPSSVAANATIASVNDADSEVEERLQEEMDEFFNAGQEAGAQLFSRVGDGLSDDKVEEIRDALEDVFDEDAPAPQAAEEGDTFLDFFKQVQTEFDQGGGDPVTQELAREVSTPQADPEPLPAPRAERPRPRPEPELSEAELQRAHLEAAGEVSTDETALLPDDDEHADVRLNLADILATADDEADVARRVDLLCRLVAKLVERVQLPESELIEVLIKSGIEF